MKKIALDRDFNFTDEQIVRLHAVGQGDKLESMSSVKNVEMYLAGTPQNIVKK